MSEQDQEEKLRRYARKLQEQAYRDILETYGPTDVHCAELAAGTLRRALADHLYQKGTPWKKTDRKV